MRLFHLAKATGAVLGRETPGVDGVADEGSVGITTVGLQLGHGDHLVDDPRQLEPGLRAVDLRLEDPPVEVVELLVEDPHEPDIAPPGMLKVGQPGDHFPPVQPVRAADVRLAGLLRHCFRLALAPLKAEPPGHGDRVDKNRVVAVEGSRVPELLAHGRVVRRAVGLFVAQAGICAADEHREIPAFRPCARPDAIAGPAFYGQIACLEVDE